MIHNEVMRRAGALVLMVVLCGCGGGRESVLLGEWNVDPASIQVSRLTPGSEAKQDWANAKSALGRMKLRFSSEPHTLTVTGLEQTDSANWRLLGNAIETPDKTDWPQLVFDPKTSRIHATMERAGDWMKMDFVKG
jgi:hypothetical protein